MDYKDYKDKASSQAVMYRQRMSRQIYAVPDLCCIVSRGLVESVGGVFEPVVSSATAVFEHHDMMSKANSQ